MGLVKPFLNKVNKVIVSANLHVYVNQSARGEVVMGAEIDPYQTYNFYDSRLLREKAAATASS